MNKRANRRAFFICATICLMYVSVVTGLPEKVSFKRISDGHKMTPQNMNIAGPQTALVLEEPLRAQDPAPQVPKAVSPAVAVPPAAPKETPVVSAAPVTPKEAPVAVPKPVDEAPVLSKDGSMVEPSILISLPLVSFAVREGLIERDGLIFTKKDGYNSGWKKPLDILKDKDFEGLKNISKSIGKKHSLDFLKKEGITIKKDLNVEDIMFGRGYSVEKEKLIALYSAYASEEYAGLFPFVYRGVGIFRGKSGFDVVRVKDDSRTPQVRDEAEWMMPNLVNLSMKTAVEKLTLHTTKVKVYGNGPVTEQSPKPFERIRGEAECSIYGRMNRQ
jgi:hypothetical protein